MQTWLETGQFCVQPTENFFGGQSGLVLASQSKTLIKMILLPAFFHDFANPVPFNLGGSEGHVRRHRHFFLSLKIHYYSILADWNGLIKRQDLNTVFFSILQSECRSIPKETLLVDGPLIQNIMWKISKF